jgi:hypothetical protein
MSNYNPNDIEVFNFFFTSVYNHHDEENLKFNEKTYQDIESFVDELLIKAENESDTVAHLLISKIKVIILESYHDLSPTDHFNLIKISNYINEKIKPQIKEQLFIGTNFDINQIVWLFKILQENHVFQNQKNELIDILHVIMNVKKETIGRYMYMKEDQEPKCIFPNLSWDELFN